MRLEARGRRRVTGEPPLSLLGAPRGHRGLRGHRRSLTRHRGGGDGHAFGHLNFLKGVGDPAAGFAMGNTDTNLKSAVEGETYEYTQKYPGFARTAREEGFTEISEWFETLARGEVARGTLPEG